VDAAILKIIIPLYIAR